jgi:hypothetical protein
MQVICGAERSVYLIRELVLLGVLAVTKGARWL